MDLAIFTASTVGHILVTLGNPLFPLTRTLIGMCDNHMINC